MGTRTVYEIVIDDGSARPAPAAILYSNSSHPTQDPRETFREDSGAASREGARGRDASHRSGDLVRPTGLLESLLSSVYGVDGGNHRSGENLFALASAPYGDFESVLSARFDGLGNCVVNERATERPEGGARSAVGVLEASVSEQGWSESAQVEALTAFVDHLGAADDLEAFLTRRAEAENGPGVEGV